VIQLFRAGAPSQLDLFDHKPKLAALEGQPIPPEVIIAHKLFDQVTGIAGHAGHEYFAAPSNRSPWPMLCTTFHDQHHGHFNYNYANTFSWWDRLMGTIHPRYDEIVERFETPPPRGKPAAPPPAE
jgi:sterol desaturase/sphingolipid hydroxylase (fatty acid hydroxylase superfamily)